MTLLTYHCYCDRCKRCVDVTPTNANRMVFVVCTGLYGKRAHAPQRMRHIGISPYKP